MTRETRGYLAALASSVFLSTTAIFIRHLTLDYQLPALVLAFWRNVFVVMTLGIVLFRFHPLLLRLERRHAGFMLFHGLTLACFNAFWTLSVAENGAAVATVMVYSSTAFTALMAYWLLNEKLTWVKLAAVALCLAGCVIVAKAYDQQVWQTNLLGILAGLLSGLFYAAYTLMGRAAAQRGLNPWTALVTAFGVAGLALLAANLLPGALLPGQAARPADLLWLRDQWAGWGLLILLAALPTVAGFGLYNVSLSYLPSSIVNLIVTTEPPFTALFAFLAFGERLELVQVAGALLILSGVVFLRLFEGRAEASTRVEAGQHP